MGTLNYGDLIGQAGEIQDTFTPLPKGTYGVQVESAEVTPTKTGKTMFKLTLVVAEQGPYTGRKLWTNLVVSPESPQALAFFFRDMAALGADAEFFRGNPDDATVCARIVQQFAKARVDFQKDDPTRNEVKGLQPAVAEAAPAAPAAPGEPAAAPAPAATPAAPRNPF